MLGLDGNKPFNPKSCTVSVGLDMSAKNASDLQSTVGYSLEGDPGLRSEPADYVGKNMNRELAGAVRPLTNRLPYGSRPSVAHATQIRVKQ